MAFPAEQGRMSWRKRLVAPLKFGKKEILSTITALGGAATFSALSESLMHQMGINVVRQQLVYQEALRVLCSRGTRNLVRKKAVQVIIAGHWTTGILDDYCCFFVCAWKRGSKVQRLQMRMGNEMQSLLTLHLNTQTDPSLVVIHCVQSASNAKLTSLSCYLCSQHSMAC